MTESAEPTLAIVRGISMNPLLHTGDRVEMRPVERGEILCGDILVFIAADGREIIHRVIRTNPLQTRGDNCGRDDLPVPPGSPLYVAYAFRHNDENVPLSGGKKGIREFRRHQKRRALRVLISGILSPIVMLNPWRIRFATLKPVVFGSRTVYYAGKRPVGWFDRQGWHWMRFARFFVEAPPESDDRQF